ncbi:hypothetical protein EBT31_02880 [bacterium]|nr:hypothetical protein [bacterium]
MPDAVQTVFEPAPETPWGADIGSIHVSEAGIRAIRGDEETLAKGYKALGGKLDELFEDPATTFERMTTDTRNVVATLVHRASRG